MESDSRPIVVLGAAGFIGSALVAHLAATGVPVRAVTRRPSAPRSGVQFVTTPSFDGRTDWASLMTNARAVVHLASPAEAPDQQGNGTTEAEEAAHGLAVAARRLGTERTILISSIKAMGEISGTIPFRADFAPVPTDTYGEAKLRIEQAIAGAPGLVVLRPPLVYGPGVKGNFFKLLHLVARQMPLPLASVHNRRSLVFIDNLIDLIVLTLEQPDAVSGTFLLRDTEELSTPELIRHIARHLDRKARLLPFPPSLLRFAAGLAGRSAAADRLLGSLSIDDTLTRQQLGWQPRFSADDGIAATCRWFAANQSRA